MGHQPVLCQAVVSALNLPTDAVVFDGTFGRGGHAQAILSTLGPNARYIACDVDPEAIAFAQTHFKDEKRLTVVHASFGQIADILEAQGVSSVDGILWDLGVSSPQLDTAERGFSFRRDGPLDMRMDPTTGISAADFVSTASESQLMNLFFEYGEEPKSRSIARAIVQTRADAPILTTHALAQLVARYAKGTPQRHAATKTFQALRIFINQELKILSDTLPTAVSCLKPGGRFCVISFHSLEDRLVKRFFQRLARGGDLPRGVPFLESEIVKEVTLVGRAIRATEEEMAQNPRARSAVLRVVEKR